MKPPVLPAQRVALVKRTVSIEVDESFVDAWWAAQSLELKARAFSVLRTV